MVEFRKVFSLQKKVFFVAALIISVIGSTFVPSVSAQSDQRVAYSFNENTGTTIDDASSNNSDATATSPTWTSSGQYGNAIVFNGTSTRVRSNSNVSLNGAFTFGAWINNPSNQTYETIMTVGNNRAFFIDNGVLGFYDGTNEFFFGAALATNTWHYVSFVSDGTNVRAYVNAVQRGSTETISYGNTSGALQIGAYINGGGSNVDYFSGTIDEVRVHNYALTTSQIGQDRDAAISGDTTAPTLSNGAPSGTISFNTTQANVQVTTNEAATCRYSTTANTAYASMTNTFSTTGSTAHSTTVTGLTNGSSYNYYVRCQDAVGNATTSDYAVSFSVASAALGSWSTTSSLPAARSVNGATYGNGYMYLVGGLDSNGSATSTVYYAEVNSNGTIGTWNTTTSFPVSVRSVRPVYYNGYIYVAGGTPNGGDFYDTVYYAPVNSNGTIGTWNTTTSLPVAQISHSTVAHNGYLYIVGGNTGTCVNTVRYAAINSNGTIGSWNTTSSLPGARCGIVEGATVYNGNMYLVGGFNNDNITNTVFYATVNSNGTLGSWNTNANSISSAREYLGVEAYNGYLFVIAGQAGLFDNVTTSVEHAPINGNGSVGTFSAASSLPGARGYLATEVVNGYLYAIGGGTDISGGTPQTTTYYAQTSIAAPDLTAPTVSVTAPSNNATVSGTITVSATASDNVGVSGVQFLLDGNNLGSEDTSSPFSISWDTTTASNGAHVITARARDAATNQTVSSSVNVTVNNAGTTPRVAYNFNENTGTAIDDSTTNNTDATATSPTWTTSGQYGNAITFNGTSTRVRSNSDVALTGAFTFEAWVLNPTNQAYETIMTVGENRDFYLNNGVINFFNGTTNLTFGTALATNTWQHVALVSDGTTVRAYVNGVQRGTTQNMTLGSVTARLQVGAWIYGSSNADYFSGTVDEVRVYNRALSATEVQNDMNTAIGSGSDTTAPTRSGGLPTGSLSSGTTQSNLQVTTNENATCRYSTTANTAYGSMTNTFSTTGSTSHSTQVTGLTNGTSYNYYVRCQDSSSNANTSDYTISFSVANSGGSNTYSMRFFGNGTNDIDRVKIPLTTNRTIDVEGNFTLEWWMRAASGNTSGNCSASTTTGDNWIDGRIIFDRDIFSSTPDNGDYGISLFQDGRLAFGVTASNGSGATLCSSSTVDLYDNAWHHIAATRNTSTGQMCFYIDGTQRGCTTGPTGNIGYLDSRSTGYPNSDPYFVIGAEKHDAGAAYPSYTGWLDEVRMSNSVRYTSNFTAPATELTEDANTMALYHFDEGSGTTLTDDTGDNNGQVSVGGNPSGPLWDNSVLPF